MVTTLRGIHERCKARHHFEKWTLNPKGYRCGWCEQPWPCPDHKDAVAALAILDDAQWDAYGKAHLRLVPDPESP